MIALNITQARINYRLALILLVYVLVWCYTLTSYLPISSLSFLLGLLTLPFTFMQSIKKPSCRYGVVAALFVVICFLVPVKTNLFFCIGFALLFLAESFFIRGSFLSSVTLFLVAPAFQYAVNVFSFPIRLQLTAWAGRIFSFAINNVQTRGNIIYHNGNEFSVDPACMGLNMLISSLLISIMLIGFWMKKSKKTVYWYWLLLYGITALFFNVLGNLFRILLLVQFSILPGTIMHDVVGITCLLLYVVLPTAYIARFVVNQAGKPILLTQANDKNIFPKYGPHFLFAALIVFSACRVEGTDTFKEFALSTGQVNKYRASEFAPGIIKLESNESLVYVKYVRGFYDTDHNPTICWKGSGFEFQEIEQTFIGGSTVFTALLVNGKEKLYTAWWYGNGKSNTNDQLTWRWDMIKGAKDYAVINVTASKKENLQNEVKDILQKNSLSPLFKNNITHELR